MAVALHPASRDSQAQRARDPLALAHHGEAVDLTVSTLRTDQRKATMDITVTIDVNEIAEELDLDDVKSDIRTLEESVGDIEARLEELDRAADSDLYGRIYDIERALKRIAAAIKEGI